MGFSRHAAPSDILRKGFSRWTPRQIRGVLLSLLFFFSFFILFFFVCLFFILFFSLLWFLLRILFVLFYLFVYFSLVFYRYCSSFSIVPIIFVCLFSLLLHFHCRYFPYPFCSSSFFFECVFLFTCASLPLSCVPPLPSLYYHSHVSFSLCSSFFRHILISIFDFSL